VAVERHRRPSLALRDDDLQGGVDLGQLIRENCVDYDALDLDDPADVAGAAVCALLVSHASPGVVISRGCERRRNGRPSHFSLSNGRLCLRSMKAAVSLTATRAA